MYGPLVLAARLGTEGLTTSMIYGGSGPRGFDDGYPMPAVDLRRRTPSWQQTRTAAPAPPDGTSGSNRSRLRQSIRFSSAPKAASPITHSYL